MSEHSLSCCPSTPVIWLGDEVRVGGRRSGGWGGRREEETKRKRNRSRRRRRRFIHIYNVSDILLVIFTNFRRTKLNLSVV